MDEGCRLSRTLKQAFKMIYWPVLADSIELEIRVDSIRVNNPFKLDLPIAYR